MAGYTNSTEGTSSTDEAFDREANRVFLRHLWVATASRAISAFDFPFEAFDKELDITRLRELIGSHLGLQDDWSLESTERIVADGKLRGLAACKPLPPPFPCNYSSKLAIWEAELRSFACERLKIGSTPASGADASSPTVALCVVLCAHWGYRLPESCNQQLDHFISQVWRLLPPTRGQIKDVGGGELEASIRASLRSSLGDGAPLGKETFYYEREWPEGSDQTRGETEILGSVIPQLVRRLQEEQDFLIVELGAGDSTKTEPLLDQLNARYIRCSYWIVEINKNSLEKRVRQLDEKYNHVECSGLYGNFKDGVAMAAIHPGKKVIMSLGSTATNFDYGQALDSLRMCYDVADLLVFGHQGPDGVVVHDDAYHTKQFNSFMWHGLVETANRILGAPEFNMEEWDMRCHVRGDPWTHEFILYRQRVERFRAFSSIKYTETEFSAMVRMAGAPSPDVYRDPETAMRVYVVDRARVSTNAKDKDSSREEWVLNSPHTTL